MPNAEQLYEIAVQHANNGLPVFPCVMNDKRPATARGFYDATTDLGQIDAWFKPQKNSGIVHNIAACPDDIGCFVVDCDGSAGATSWLGLAISTGTLGEAGLVIETPSGGRHYWFKGQLHSSVRKVAPGIDIRGIGGYVLLPGSSIDGREYKIVGSGSFDQITPAPPALFEYFTQAQEKGEYVQRITSEYAPEPGSPVAHAWCRAWTERQINAGRLPQRGTRNAWATAFYIQMYTHGATAEYARELHELVYEHGGARPDVEPCPKIESLIERIWDGKLRCNPAGSELPLASMLSFWRRRRRARTRHDGGQPRRPPGRR